VTFPELIDKIEMIDLDSSTDEKFSHHLIVNIFDHENDPVLFTDNLQGIYFVVGLPLKFKYSEKCANRSTLFIEFLIKVEEMNFFDIFYQTFL
jgi:hypothetical protein